MGRTFFPAGELRSKITGPCMQSSQRELKLRVIEANLTTGASCIVCQPALTGSASASRHYWHARAARNNLNVVRFFGFPALRGFNLQTRPGQYTEQAFVGIDRVIAAASDHGYGSWSLNRRPPVTL